MKAKTVLFCLAILLFMVMLVPGSEEKKEAVAVGRVQEEVLTVVGESTRAQDKEPGVLKDRYGVPLPPGAIARLGTTRLRHSQGWRLVDAAFSPDGKMLASFGGDSRLRVWDTANGKELRSGLLKSFSSIWHAAVAFSGDGKTVAVSSYRNLALCDVGGAEPRVLPEQSDPISGLAFAPDSKLLAVYGSARSISLIDPATGKEVRQLRGHEKAILGAVFSADGKTLATSSEDLTCRIWNVADGKQQSKLETNKLKALMLDLSPDGKWIAWWDEEGKIHVHDVATGKEKTSFDAGTGALFILDWRQSTMRFTPDGTLEALNWSRHFSQWHPEKGWKSRTFEPVWGNTAFGRIAPDGKNTVLWDWDHGTSLHLFDLETGKEKEVAVGHLKMVRTVLAQPGGKLVASTSSDGTIRLWDPANSKELRRWRPECAFQPAVFTPDGKALAFSDYDKKSFIRVVELDTDKQLQRLDTERTYHLAFSGNGKLLLTADFTRIEVWDVTQGKRLRELEDVPETKLPPLILSEHAPWLTYTVNSLNVSPDGTKAAAAFVRSGGECSLYLWDTATGKKIPGWLGNKQFNAPIAFSPDGKVLAAVQQRKQSENDVVLWDFAKEEFVKRFPIADISCNCVAFSRDGKLLAVSGYYKSIVQVYEVATSKEIARFEAHEGPVTLTFSSDGSTLITGGEDSTLLIWDLRSKVLQKE
jgi:WD40 repeat protein